MNNMRTQGVVRRESQGSLNGGCGGTREEKWRSSRCGGIIEKIMRYENHRDEWCPV